MDAEHNTVNVEAKGFDLVTATVQSVRPFSRFTHFSRCSTPSSAPDDWSYPSADSIALSHRNMAEDTASTSMPSGFNSTLLQQGLDIDSLQSGDKWSNRQFGFVVSGRKFLVDGASGTSLVSTTPCLDEVCSITITTLSKQTSSSRSWSREVFALHEKYKAGDPHARRTAHEKFWNSSGALYISVHSQFCPRRECGVRNLTERYEQTRYVQAIQAGTWVPVKFNGMTLVGQLPPETNLALVQVVGSSNWWQNTRFPYWNMAAAGDFESLATIFKYHMQMPLLNHRTRSAFKHGGAYVTETRRSSAPTTPVTMHRRARSERV